MKETKARMEAMEWWYLLTHLQKLSISPSGRNVFSLTGREIEMLYEKHKKHNENLKELIIELKK